MSVQELIITLLDIEIISSIMTGVIVGLILWAFQLRREKSVIKHRYERDLSILKEQLYFVNYRGHAYEINNMVDSQPLFIEEIIEILRNHPLDLMERYAYHNKSLAASLQEIKKHYLEVRKNAEQLELLINDYIRHYNGNRGVTAEFDLGYKIYMIGKIYDWKDEEIRIYIDDGEISDDMRKLFLDFQETHDSLIRYYNKVRDELIQSARLIEGMARS